MGRAATEPRSRRSKRTGALAVSLVLAAAEGGSKLAAVQPAPEPVVCETDPLCRDRVARAEASAREGNAKGALLLYKLAYKERPDPRLLYRLARLHQEQGQLTEAAEAYKAFLDQPAQDEESRRHAQAFLTQQSRRMGSTLAGADPPRPRPASGKGNALLLTGGIFLGIGALHIATGGAVFGTLGKKDEVSALLSVGLMIYGSVDVLVGAPMAVIGGHRHSQAVRAEAP